MSKSLGYEYHDGIKVRIAITHFDIEQCDSIDDLVREELEQKGTVIGLIERMVEYRMEAERAEVISSLISIIRKAKRPDLALTQAAFAAGIILKKTGTELGGSFGVSKQAFNAGVKKYGKKLGMRQTRIMRDDDSRDLMRLTNHRNESHE
jgi:hypothetical protein